MRSITAITSSVAKTYVCVCILLTAAGCNWMSPATRVSTDPSTESDSVRIELFAENKGLRDRVQSQELDIAKLRAENRRQVEMNKLLTDELENMKNDLDRVENQFVSLEKRLRLKETKASAVASVAEAQLLFEKMLESGADVLDSLTVSEVTAKLKTSDEMIKKRNYAAAVYFSNRTMRILNQTERRMNVVMTDGDSRIIAVSLANVRSGPGSGYEIIEKLNYGTVIVQIDTNANWSKIRTKDGTAGWVHKSLIR